MSLDVESRLNELVAEGRLFGGVPQGLGYILDQNMVAPLHEPTKVTHLSLLGEPTPPASSIIARLAFALVLCALAPGCTSLFSGGAPEPSYNSNQDLEQLAQHFSQATAISEYYKLPQTKERRNEFVVGRLTMVNIRYLQFIQKITNNRQFLDSATDILVLGLNLAGTGVDSAATKTVLSAISAGVTGSKAVIDKEYFYEKTMPALIAAMNAQRATALVPISQGMKLSLQDYSFEQGLVDIDNYYFAGTLVGAAQAIQADSGAKQKAAEVDLKNIREGTFKQDDAGVRLQKFLFRPGGTMNDANKTKLDAWLKTKGFDPGAVDYTLFVHAAEFASLRQQAVTDLKVDTNGVAP